MASKKDNWLVEYLRDSWNELQKVSWPSRERVIRDTALVVGVCIITAIFFGISDFALGRGLEWLVTQR